MTTLADRVLAAWHQRNCPTSVWAVAKQVDPYVQLVRRAESTVRFYQFRDGSVIETSGRSTRHVVRVRSEPLPVERALPSYAIRSVW
jgi:hypothetical protein